MVAVHSLRTTEIAVGVVHLAFPLFAVGICTATYAALGLFNGNVERTNLHMTFLVIAGFFLRLGGLGVYIGRGFFYLCRYRFFRFFLLRFWGFANFARGSCRNVHAGGYLCVALLGILRCFNSFDRLFNRSMAVIHFLVFLPVRSLKYSGGVYIPICAVVRQFYHKSIIMLVG